MAKNTKPEAEKHTATLPVLRVTPAQAKQLKDDADRAGYGRKLSTYRRLKYFDKPPKEQDGLPVSDVMRLLSLIGRARGFSRAIPALDELLNEMTRLLMAVIKPKS